MKNRSRMRPALALWLLAAGLLAGTPAQAQIVNCNDCILGLYDDAARTTVMGTSTTGTIKDIYLGIDYAPPETGLVGLEFSIHGMRNVEDGIFIVAQDWVVAPNVAIGVSISAPADTTLPGGQGGLTCAWQNCQPGSRTLMRLSFLHFAPVVNKVFRVMRKFPPSNVLYLLRPVIVRCDAPIFSQARISGACYILNWDGDPNAIACLDGPVGVEPRAWSSVKALYR